MTTDDGTQLDLRSGAEVLRGVRVPVDLIDLEYPRGEVHTEGPFIRYGLLIVDQNESLIADLRMRSPVSALDSYKTNAGRSLGESVANAILFQYAPDMLAMCDRVLHYLKRQGGPGHLINELESLIGKARGIPGEG